MGLLLERGDVGKDAFALAVRTLRWLKGGLGIATVFANAIFASITGSSLASASVFSRIAVPPMVYHGFKNRFAVGIVDKKKILNNNSCLNALSSKANLNPEKLLIVAKYSLLIPLFFLAEVAFWFFFSVFCKFYSNMLVIIY